MRTLISADLQQFLNENGYNWTGYIAENTSQATEEYYRCSKWQNDLNDHYIILGKTYDWDEEKGHVCVRDNKHVRYIIQDDTTLKVCNRLSDGRLSLEKDLSDKWVEYQAKTIPGYTENILTQCKSIQANYSRKVQDRKNLTKWRESASLLKRSSRHSISVLTVHLAKLLSLLRIWLSVMIHRLQRKSISKSSETKKSP